VKEVRVGDIVTRKSYQGDILFRVEAVNDEGAIPYALLRGLFVRLYADAPLDDLDKKNTSKKHGELVRQLQLHQSLSRKTALDRSVIRDPDNNFFELPGRVLHLDGDRDYRELCLRTYLQLDVPCRVIYVPEREQSAVVYKYLREENPDILVITGHDGLVKEVSDYRQIDNYRNSRYFIDTVRRAREYDSNKDNLVIIAGGCQSFYEALIDAGANFASAPERVLIHALDPVFIAERIAFTSIYEKISLSEVLDFAVCGQKGIGGVQTRGKFRLGLPRFQY
jgi:spore coat assembly protein